MNRNKIILISGLLLLSALSCRKLGPKAPTEEDLLDGPVEGLTYEQNKQFLRGDVAFNDEVFTAATGLGPVFVTNSCGSCHAGDGKGHPFSTLTRFGQTDSTGNKFLDKGGPQLQHRAIPGYQPEQIPAGATYARFLPPANTGLGFIELVSDADIIAFANANQSNPDGVRGRPNWVNLPWFVTPRTNAITQGGRYIGRFGKKAGVYNLLQQTVGAYNQDMGVTSAYSPIDPYSHQEVEPEVTNATVHDVVFYLQTLKAPIQRNPGDADVKKGKEIFINTGCETCHRQTLHTGDSPIPALANKDIHPYTDLLLHDMGAGLDDGYTEGNAKTSEWRTPPLWGLGLSKDSQGGTYFLMHDGRATSISAAIEMHGGEASVSKNKYTALSDEDKKALVKFLESL